MSEAPIDQIPLDHTIVAASRPDRLAVASWLAGGPRPAGEPQRVVCLGCGAGANLLALAFYHPTSTFLGIDPSALAIAAAQVAAEELGVSNLRFESHPLTDVPPAADLGGAFDYVFVHDQLSWVGEGGRAALLSTCGALLAPEGVAYLDHAVPAGWHLRATVQRWLLRAMEGVDDPAARIEQAQRSAHVLAALLPEDADDPYVTLLGRELAHAVQLSPAELTRFYLADADLMTFGEVDRQLEPHGLRFVAEAELAVDNPEQQSRAGLRSQLLELGLTNRDREELIDTLTGRRFRTAILCRADAPSREWPAGSELRQLYVAADVAPDRGELILDPDEPLELVTGMDVVIRSDSPLVSAALAILGEIFPSGLRIDELIDQARLLLEDHGVTAVIDEAAREEVCEQLLDLCARGVAEPRLWEPGVTSGGGQPHALARLEAARSGFVTTPYHTVLPLTPITQQVIVDLSEATDHREVITRVADRIASGELELELEGLDLEDREDIEAAVHQIVESVLASFGTLGLLAGD